MKFSAFCLALAVSAALGGCANKYDAVTPDVQAGMLADLRAGKLNLDCGLNCRITWDTQVAGIHALDLSEHWNDLAVQVMKIGYGNDLAYYYLGQAAQGLGYQQAAIGYYNYALALTNGTNPLVKCGAATSGNTCQGVDIAASVPVLIAASQAALAQQAAAAAAAAEQPAPVHHARKKSPIKPASASGGSGFLTPPPPDASSPAAPPANGNSGFLTPPPAATAQ